MYFNLNFCNPSFKSRYKSLLIWYLPDIWTTYKEIHLCLYYVWIMHTITTWPQQTLLICSPKNHYNVNKQVQLISAVAVRYTCHLPAYILCYNVKTVKKLDCFTDTGTPNLFPLSLILFWMIMLLFFCIFFVLKSHSRICHDKKVILLKRKMFNLLTKVWNFLLDLILLHTF